MRAFGFILCFLLLGCDSEIDYNSSEGRILDGVKFVTIPTNATKSVLTIPDGYKLDFVDQDHLEACNKLISVENELIAYFEREKVCYYTVGYNNESNNSRIKRNIAIAALSNGEFSLSPLSKLLNVSEVVNIDVESEIGASFPNGYSLSSVKSLNDGLIEYSKGQNSFSFTSASPGLKRVLYTLENSGGDDNRIGVVDFYVNNDVRKLDIESFNTTTNTNSTIGIEIDLSEIYPVSDLGDYQLVELSSINANVFIVSENKEIIGNKKFSVTANEKGTFYVFIVIVNSIGETGTTVGRITFI
ncbi:hypothetical protein L1D52_04150 [Vibrio brasiliensis]|uniref:hypothetical protein n=1 Tax=Vibrio brasiliensis TaxID=170652 RepID=UPI001EFC45E2|nr:hypothetical protein [Vibrio brasiliensis]MCG9781533.1 hypothetical protein [Vibrio brasiliensis]